MKRLLLSSLIAIAAFGVAVPVAFAQDEPEESGSATKSKKPDDRFCIQQTGSRIVASRNRSKKADKDCVAGSGRVYTRDDIETTGAVDVKEALRRLDPSIN